MRRIICVLAGVVALLLLSGCTSPLKSDDPATRVKAVAELSDDKEIFFVAMNVGVHIGMREGSYYNAFLTEENYADDVRVAAAKRLKNIDYLLCCAAWQDGDLYADSGLDQGRLEFKGENYYVHDSDSRLLVKVRPGESVRSAAIERLKEPDIFRQVGKSLVAAEGQEPIRKRLFPSGRRWTGSGWSDGKETSFVDYYGRIKPNNPLEVVVRRVVADGVPDSEILDFLIETSASVSLILNAYDVALRKLNGANSDAAKELFTRLFLGGDRNSQAKQDYGKAVIENPKKDWAWLVYRYISNPSTEIIKTALHYSDETSRTKILTRITDCSLLNTIALELLHNNTLESWSSGRNDELESVVQIANIISDKKTSGKLAAALVCKINAYRSKCQSGWGMSWNEKDKTEAARFTKAVDGLLSDDLLEEVVKEDDSKLSSLACLFKDKKRPSALGFTRIQNAVKGGKENDITKAWKNYGSAVYDDEMLKTLSVSSVYLRRLAFDQIKDEKVKAATLAAIKDALNKDLKDCAAKQGELANFIGEIGNGEDLVVWIKGKSGQTELQNKETFAKMKGRMVVLRGEVKNIG